MTTERNEKPLRVSGSKYLDDCYGPLSFADLLKSYRLTEEVSQTALAKKINISRQKINDFEAGRRLPNLKMVAAIAQKLGEHIPTWVAVTLEQILRDQGLFYKIEVKPRAKKAS